MHSFIYFDNITFKKPKKKKKPKDAWYVSEIITGWNYMVAVTEEHSCVLQLFLVNFLKQN